ncbi:GNAT family N-acetyltransferase [uncultured Methanobrevibacter sp.]|uniref:GNAT family N-acetyltransferase n=1 Tax=uncultured Methanobrevibacter sp. TaxID=253161 RepID=UPI0025F655B8|nr:GNAT family N-acetyltransferase [uncultured Methanobrevibacter sp.]MEE1133540.1 GNAT family N-acetyltransferase [Methanobrevibacter sp.]
MRYETFNPKIHDVSKVARFVYDVDFRTFDMLFKSPDSAVKTISKSLENEDLETFTVILDDDDNIIGMLIYYIDKFPRHFNFRSLRLLIVDILDYFVLCDVGPGDLYIAEIAIDSSLRGQGLGKQVLLEVIDYAKSQNLNRVILDADFRNEGAKRLYEKIGFREFNKKRLKFLSFERGMHNMELVLKR